MMVEKPEIPLSQMKNIAKVLIHISIDTYDMNFSSIGVHMSAEMLRKPAQQLEHPANFLVHKTRHPNSIQLILWTKYQYIQLW